MPPKFGEPPVTNVRNMGLAALARLAEATAPLLGAGQQLFPIRAGATLKIVMRRTEKKNKAAA